MSVDSRLCRTCAALPFDASCPPFGAKHDANGSPTIYLLPTLTQMANGQCVFCKLVVIAIRRIQLTEQDFQWIPPDHKIRIWVPTGLPVNGIHIIFTFQGSPKGTIIGVVREPNIFCTPISTTQVDFNRVKQWLRTCTMHHQNACLHNSDGDSETRSLFSELRTIRFIDVNKGCLVEQSSLSSYVCLSYNQVYVWGAVASLRLSKANKSHLMQRGAIKDAWGLLPKTIQDAIAAVKLLGENYLWVDSLCLVQNDPEDMENGTGCMDLIYEFSTLTIVAAGGRDANAGLPSVNVGSRFPEEHIAEVVPGLRLAVYTHGDFRVEPTVYNSRAWTLQEYALSPRILCFVDNQVFFRCRKKTFSEDSWDDILKMQQPAMCYRILIERYSYRMLTHSADIHNAVAGLTRRFSDRMKCRFLEGIPTAWNQMLPQAREGFPSYSWTGWFGPLAFWGADPEGWSPSLAISSAEESNWLSENTWIIWYKRNPSGVTSLVWDIMANESFPEDSIDHPGYRRRRSFTSQYSLGFPTTRTSPSEVTIEATILPSYPLLQFWTLSVHYKLSDIDVLRARAKVINRKGKVLGNLYLDNFDETEFFDSTEDAYEFIVLGKTPLKDETPDVSSFFVMCIGWYEPFAERRGIGNLRLRINDLKGFRPRPRWKQILLA
ncbi:heterokaryon incompatibility protein-domain-containing protein [Xylaria flabelliformis]|nr:heterokaryon incompatibility protein-domain-containing protein [Xylaria flabelliformis]